MTQPVVEGVPRAGVPFMAALAAIIAVLWLTPAHHAFGGLANYLPLHIFLETVSIIVSFLVFGIAWNAWSRERAGNIVILGCVFFAVALVDFLHLLSYKGMPPFITPGDPEKAINFWLAARFLAAIGLLAAGLRPWVPCASPRTRWVLLGAAAVLSIAIGWVGLFHQHDLPHTFIEGEGLTPLKLGAEYALVALYAAGAAVFYRRSRQPQAYDAHGLFTACAVSALSEINFTLYVDVTDVFNLLGHLYKVIAYGFIYRAVFVDSVHEPFHRLWLAENEGRLNRALLERIFDTTHFLIAYLDRDFNFIRVNRAYADADGRAPDFFPGKNHFALYPNAENEAIFHQVMETAVPYTAYARPFEYAEHPERGLTYWDWMVSPVRGADGCLDGLVLSLVNVTERQKAEQRAGYLHLHDELTGLPNRVLLLDRLQQVVVEVARRGREAAVLCVDLDHFKYVNETLGHAAGDALLKQAAERLSACVRPGDSVARLAGDQFVLALADMASMDDVGLIVQKIMSCGAKPFLFDGQEYFMSLSLGIALYPIDSGNAEQLLKFAELAMHQAKERGGNGYQFYSSQMADKATERVALSNELRQALEQGQFLLYYQPQVDIASGAIVGAEALIRWKHPQRGLVPPATFIPLAEEIGLIGPLGEWVLRQACDQTRAWRAAGLPPLRVAVNVSAQQFRYNNLAHAVQQSLHDCTLPPSNLEIEVTESILMPGDDAPLVMLRKIADLGVSISIDDFGTGYSGLSYLKRFPISNIKVDRSFVRDLATDNDDASIVHAIIAMAHGLELKVVAEGVETGDQLALLRAYGCDLAQGFYFSPPLPAEEFARLLRERHDFCWGKDYVEPDLAG